jgi:hypothetical protein
MATSTTNLSAINMKDGHAGYVRQSVGSMYAERVDHNSRLREWPRHPKKARISSSSSSSSPSSKRGFSLESLTVLQAWLDKHQDNPYPTRQEKEDLAEAATLTVKQVSNWFSNTRKRQLNPFEKWLSSGSEDEAASPHDIYRAAEEDLFGHNQPFGGIVRRNTSGSSAGSIISSAGSAFSQCSDAILSGPQRRGKRKHAATRFEEGMHIDLSLYSGLNLTVLAVAPTQKDFFEEMGERLDKKLFEVLSTKEDPTTSPANFQCTFCHKSLTPKAWKRHEESQHLPRYRWVCMVNELAPQDFPKLRTATLILKNIPLSVQRAHLLQFLHDLWLPSPQIFEYEYKQGIFVGSARASFVTAKAAAKVKEDIHKRRLFGQELEAHYTVEDDSINCVCCSKEAPEIVPIRHLTAQCLEKLEKDRTFFRKDGIIQHLKFSHHLVLSDEILLKWRTTNNYSQHNWNCGFCGEQLADWDTRATHISHHFRHGLDMRHWDSNLRLTSAVSNSRRDSYTHEEPLLSFDAPLLPNVQPSIADSELPDLTAITKAYKSLPQDSSQLTLAVSESVGGLPSRPPDYKLSSARFLEYREGTIPDYLLVSPDMQKGSISSSGYCCISGCSNFRISSLSRWREHAETHLPSPRRYKCTQRSCDGRLCGHVFSYRENLSRHLVETHHIHRSELQTALDQSCLDEVEGGRREMSQFWCGFCRGVVKTIGKNKGSNVPFFSSEADRRLDHITQHILAQSSTDGWVDLWAGNISCN